MAKPNFEILRKYKFSKENNKPLPRDSEMCWREFLIANFNFINHCSFKITEDEISKITISLQNWTDKRNFNQYKPKIGDVYKTVDVNVGDILLADLGLRQHRAIP